MHQNWMSQYEVARARQDELLAEARSAGIYRVIRARAREERRKSKVRLWTRPARPETGAEAVGGWQPDAESRRRRA